MMEQHIDQLHQCIKQDFLEKIAPKISTFSHVLRIIFFFIPNGCCNLLAEIVPNSERVFFPTIKSGFWIDHHQCAESAYYRIEDALWDQILDICLLEHRLPHNLSLVVFGVFFRSIIML